MFIKIERKNSLSPHPQKLTNIKTNNIFYQIKFPSESANISGELESFLNSDFSFTILSVWQSFLFRCGSNLVSIKSGLNLRLARKKPKPKDSPKRGLWVLYFWVDIFFLERDFHCKTTCSFAKFNLKHLKALLKDEPCVKFRFILISYRKKYLKMFKKI